MFANGLKCGECESCDAAHPHRTLCYTNIASRHIINWDIILLFYHNTLRRVEGIPRHIPTSTCFLLRKDPAPTSFEVVEGGCIAAFGAEEYSEHQAGIHRLIEVRLGLKPSPVPTPSATARLNSLATTPAPAPAPRPESPDPVSADKNDTNEAVISYTEAPVTLPKLSQSKSSQKHLSKAASDTGDRATSPTPTLSGPMVADVQHCGWLDVTFDGERQTLFVVLVHSGFISCHTSEDMDAREPKTLPDLTITGSSRVCACSEK